MRYPPAPNDCSPKADQPRKKSTKNEILRTVECGLVDAEHRKRDADNVAAVMGIAAHAEVCAMAVRIILEI